MTTCRICDESGDNLVAPCACTGTSKYVHGSCLQRWIDTSGQNKCNVCNIPFMSQTMVRGFIPVRLLTFINILLYRSTIIKWCILGCISFYVFLLTTHTYLLTEPFTFIHLIYLYAYTWGIYLTIGFVIGLSTTSRYEPQITVVAAYCRDYIRIILCAYNGYVLYSHSIITLAHNISTIFLCITTIELLFTHFDNWYRKKYISRNFINY